MIACSSLFLIRTWTPGARKDHGPCHVMASASHNKRFSSSLSMSLLRDMNANVGIMETPVRDNTQSRLPSYRGSDLAFAGRGFLSVTGCSALSLTASKKTLELDAENDDKRARAAPSSPLSPSSSPSISLSPPAPSGPGISRALGQIHHERSNPIDARIAEHADTDTPRRSRKMSLAPPKATTVASPPAVPLDATVNLTKTAKQHPPKGRNAGPPPPSMLNRGLLCEPSSSTSISPSDDGADSNSTNTWVVQQQIHSRTPSADQNPPVQSQDQHPEHDQDQQYRLARSQTEPAPARRSLIKPIRGFKLSSQRKSAEMASRRMSYNDSSLQALEGRGGSDNAYNALAHPDQQDEQNSDDSDLFLRAAREEELQAGNMNVDGPGRAARARAPSGPSMAFQQSPEVCGPCLTLLYTFNSLFLSETMCAVVGSHID